MHPHISLDVFFGIDSKINQIRGTGVLPWRRAAQMKIKSLACIGSRNLPVNLAQLLEEIGSWITNSGIVLNTGNADGSDQHFAAGGNRNPALVHLHLPCANYNSARIDCQNKVYFQYDQAIADLAARVHPAWNNLGPTAKKFLVRNASIVSSSDAVIAYQSYSKPWGGGTGHGLKIAEELGKKSFLISLATTLGDVSAFVESCNG